MFILVGASTGRSSVRVACVGPVEALVKWREMAESGIGAVAAYDFAGAPLDRDDLAAMAARMQCAIPAPDAMRALLAETLSGSDVDVDATAVSLHDMTQLAIALRPGASLRVRNSLALSPLEQASITSAMPGQVQLA